jgi:uncharacterized radical SAM superfamily Fe-S cluster-containing enzyme
MSILMPEKGISNKTANDKERLLRRTKTVCRSCSSIIPAEIFTDGSQLLFRSECPDCGKTQTLHPENADFFQKVLAAVGERGKIPAKYMYPHGEPLPPLRGVMLDLTSHCNLNCPDCISAANQVILPEPDLATLKNWFEQITSSLKGRRPVIYLLGGEPTLREDLPEIIALLRGLRFPMKLVTNGLRLTDRSYARELRRSGLEWVFLQFDSLTAEATLKIRGKDVLDQKMRALENLAACEFKILLACMVKKGVNLDQVGPVLDLALKTPQVQEVSFLPASRLGREPDPTKNLSTNAYDVMQAIEESTKGALVPQDFISFLKISRSLWQLTHNPDYKPKTCFFTMVLLNENGAVTPINRLVSSRAILSPVKTLKSLLPLLRHIRRLDEMPYNPKLLTMVIEHFRDPDAFDLDDAMHCSKYYICDEGLMPCCVYNAFYRCQTSACIAP